MSNDTVMSRIPHDRTVWTKENTNNVNIELLGCKRVGHRILKEDWWHSVDEVLSLECRSHTITQGVTHGVDGE